MNCNPKWMEWLVLSLHWSCFNLSVIQCYHVKVIDSLFIPNMFALNCWLFRNQEFGPNWSIFHLILFLLQPKFLITPHEIFIHLVLFLSGTLQIFVSISWSFWLPFLEWAADICYTVLSKSSVHTRANADNHNWSVVSSGIVWYHSLLLQSPTQCNMPMASF